MRISVNDDGTETSRGSKSPQAAAASESSSRAAAAPRRSAGKTSSKTKQVSKPSQPSKATKSAAATRKAAKPKKPSAAKKTSSSTRAKSPARNPKQVEPAPKAASAQKSPEPRSNNSRARTARSPLAPGELNGITPVQPVARAAAAAPKPAPRPGKADSSPALPRIAPRPEVAAARPLSPPPSQTPPRPVSPQKIVVYSMQPIHELPYEAAPAPKPAAPKAPYMAPLTSVRPKAPDTRAAPRPSVATPAPQSRPAAAPEPKSRPATAAAQAANQPQPAPKPISISYAQEASGHAPSDFENADFSEELTLEDLLGPEDSVAAPLLPRTPKPAPAPAVKPRPAASKPAPKVTSIKPIFADEEPAAPSTAPARRPMELTLPLPRVPKRITAALAGRQRVLAGTKRLVPSTRRSRLVAATACAVLIASAGGLLWWQHSHGSAQGAVAPALTHTATLTRGSPDFATVLPAGKSIDSLGGWTRVSPPKSDPVYAYSDVIDSVPVNVSEQLLPERFQTDTANAVADLAKEFNATDKLSVQNTTAYLGTSAQGPQSLIVNLGELLLLIKSNAPIPADQWSAYVQSLR